MTVSQWIKSLFAPSVDSPRTKAVLRMADEVTESARALRSHLDSYMCRKDPFVALVADAYEREQENRVWRGTSH